jgi:hypothetical protein
MAASDITDRNPRFSNSRARHNQHLGVLDQARARAQVKPGCDSLGRHAQVFGKSSSQCCAITTMATNSHGVMARLIGGERFSTCAHLLASMVAELVHAHTYVHAHSAEASGVSRRKNVGGELAAYGLLARAGVHGGVVGLGSCTKRTRVEAQTRHEVTGRNVWLRPLAQTIEHVVSMQKCSFNHAIPVFQRRQEHARHEGRPSQAVKKEGLNHLKLRIRTGKTSNN